MTEAELVAKVVRYVRRAGLRVQDPDYLRTNRYAPQWRVMGPVYYYQLPHGGTVIALRNSRTGFCDFAAKGFDEHTLYTQGARP